MATTIGISGTDWTINGTVTHQGETGEGLLFNARLVNAIFDDENATTKPNWEYTPSADDWDPQRNTDEFCDFLPYLYDHGIRLFTVGMQGGWPGQIVFGDNQTAVVSAYNSDGTLKTDWMNRLRQVLQTADDLGMVALLNLFYFGQDHRLTNETAVLAAVDNTVAWLLTEGFNNVLVEVVNEANQFYDHAIMSSVGGRVIELVQRVQSQSSGALKASYSLTGGSTPSNAHVSDLDFILLHGNAQSASNKQGMIDNVQALSNYSADPKPILFTEDDFISNTTNLTDTMTLCVAEGVSPGWYHQDFQDMPGDWTAANLAETLLKRTYFERAAIYTDQPPHVEVHGAVSTGSQTNGTLALTFSHTIASGNKLCLFVGVGIDTVSDDGAMTCTWDGTPMTLIGEVRGSSTSQQVALFRLLDPSVGTFNVVINSGNTTAAAFKCAYAVTLATVDQATPVGTPAVASGSVNALSASILGTPKGMFIDVACMNGQITITSGFGQTVSANFNVGGGAGTMLGGSRQTGAVGGVMEWTFATARSAQVAVGVNASVFVAFLYPTSTISAGSWTPVP